MTTKQIDYCIELAHTLNFSRAAENMFVSQPTFSYQIKLLEEEIGFAVFERSGKGAALTPAGAQFVAALANLRYTAILWARGREAATYAGNLPGASDGAQEYTFALRLVQAYKGMCAELIEDRGFLFTGIREAADEGAV